jgi:hypothetical protein
MDIRTKIRVDFDVDLNIGEGDGTLAAPLELLSTDCVDAAGTELQFIKLVSMALNRQWRVVSREWLTSDKNVLNTKIEVFEVDGEEVATTVVNYYFTLRTDEIGSVPLIVAPKTSKIPLPYCIEWVHFDDYKENTPEEDDTTYFYLSRYLKLNVYVYSLNEVSLTTGVSDALRQHTSDCVLDMQAVHPDYQHVGDTRVDDETIMQMYSGASETSYLLMSAVGGKVIKARITHAAIWELGEIASQTLNYIRFLVHCAIEKEKSE